MRACPAPRVEVRRPAPKPDQHRVEMSVRSWRHARAPRPSSQVISTMRSALEGVRVLDLCIILAGPTCGRTLAEFGADVIKIDNPARGGFVQSHNDVNRGKRSILLDLKSDEGATFSGSLVDTADVVAQNYRAGKLEKLGLGYEEVRKRKPDIIYASLNAYGHLGPWATRPGHEQFAQATTGMQRRFGGDGQPRYNPIRSTITALVLWGPIPWRWPCCIGSAPARDSTWIRLWPTPP